MRFIYLGSTFPTLVGTTGTIVAKGTTTSAVLFDHEPDQMLRVPTADIAPHGSVQIRGLSLSFCVRDIVERRVNILDVGLLTIGSSAATDDAWNALIDEYAATYWRNYKDEAKSVVNMLLMDAKIEQPRCHGGCAPRFAAGHHWIAR